jgi:septal ring factor EnvC (AmiA/AmiB activator)
MKRKSIITVFAVAFGYFCVFVLVAGCDQANDKRCRLIADENMQLKRDVGQLKGELGQRDEEIKTQKEQIESCLQDRKLLEEASQKSFSKDINDIAGLIMEENAALLEEIENLKAQIPEPNKQPENKPSQ